MWSSAFLIPGVGARPYRIIECYSDLPHSSGSRIGAFAWALQESGSLPSPLSDLTPVTSERIEKKELSRADLKII